ncbi:hypothetical protein V6N13_015396 [Hibiscus sabdariffa]
MVTPTGSWDWDGVRDLLPEEVLEQMVVTPPPLTHLGDDVPGWRWNEKREFRETLLGREAATQCATLSFEEWLHGNISGSLPTIVAGVDWGMQFSILCWLLWKLRCSMVLDAGYVQRESVLDRGKHLILECESAFAKAALPAVNASQVVQQWEEPQGDYSDPIASPVEFPFLPRPRISADVRFSADVFSAHF